MKKSKFNPRLLSTIKTVISHEIAASRKPILNELVKYINSKRASESEVYLNFICTHNSRGVNFVKSGLKLPVLIIIKKYTAFLEDWK